MKIMKYFILPILCGIFALNTMAQSFADLANAGDQALADGNFPEAIDNYLQALELDTAKVDYTTAYNLVLAYYGVTDYKSAAESFKN